MRKDFGKQTWVLPQVVLIIGTYDKDGKADIMNAAWGGVYDANTVMLCLDEDHKTTKNIRENKAFTVSFGDVKNLAACDYVGIVSANDEPDKLKKSGFTTFKSNHVNAPIINELPVALECKLIKFNEDGIVVGEIVNVCADESVLGADGKIDSDKLDLITFDPIHASYRRVGEKVGNAFSDGKKLK